MNQLKIHDVRVLKGDSGFLIDDGKTSILCDSGFGFTGEKLAENIRNILGNRQLDFIFLTHSHYDHALGSAAVLEAYPNAKVAAGSYAASIFRRDGAKKVMRELDSKFAEINGISEYEFIGDGLRVDIELNDGDILRAGDLSFEVLNLPGHTKCSVGFYCRERKFFISSETLGVYDGEKNIMPSFLVGCEMTLNSIERVSALEIEKILMPHYGVLNREQTEYFLKNMKSGNIEAIGMIAEKLRNGEDDKDILECFKKRYFYGYIREISPLPALELNTSIMINLVRKEIVDK